MMSASATQGGHNNSNTSICKARNVSKHTESEAQAVAESGGWRE